MYSPFASATKVVDGLKPFDPIHCVHTNVLRRTARHIVGTFPGDVLYAVKCNDHPMVLKGLVEGGLKHFDAASINEIRQVRELFGPVGVHFMHPIKSGEAIREAYYRHGVRSFALDHEEELDKIVQICGGGADLTLVIRVEVPQTGAMMALAGKFGATPVEAARLLRRSSEIGEAVGLTFHVGSQSLSPEAFAVAIRLCAEIARDAGVQLDLLDVGGGFPGRYRGDEPDFTAFAWAVRRAVAESGLPKTCRLQAEPGRALVADGLSIIARVDLRRGNALFLNDGVYGSLSELKYLGPVFPMRVHRTGGTVSGKKAEFQLFGPTCDSVDSMPGPYILPEDIRTGDWIEIQKMGAYSNALRTRFNGFDDQRFVEIGTPERQNAQRLRRAA